MAHASVREPQRFEYLGDSVLAIRDKSRNVEAVLLALRNAPGNAFAEPDYEVDVARVPKNSPPSGSGRARHR